MDHVRLQARLYDWLTAWFDALADHGVTPVPPGLPPDPRLLEDEGRGSKEIAAALGFTHTSYFSTWFKRLTGAEPATFAVDPDSCTGALFFEA